MLNKIKNRKQEGFTIIEVLIVLAIAGLILLVVFLAVPALQRNSRNTQRKSEVSGMLGAVNEWTNNNGGTLPATATDQTNALANAKLSFYKTANISWAAGSGTNDNDAEKVKIVTGAKCSGSNAVAGSGRQLALLYTVETGGSSPQQICQDS
jgi:prepilin-type N-terminal cleavage/methylation domain-containing protein